MFLELHFSQICLVPQPMKRTPAPSLAVPGVPSKLLHSTSEQGLSPKRFLKGCKGNDCSYTAAKSMKPLNLLTPQNYLSQKCHCTCKISSSTSSVACWSILASATDTVRSKGSHMERWRFIPTLCQLWWLPGSSKDSDQVSKMLRIRRTKTLRWTTLNHAKCTNLPAESGNGLRNPSILTMRCWKNEIPSNVHINYTCISCRLYGWRCDKMKFEHMHTAKTTNTYTVNIYVRACVHRDRLDP